MKFIWFLSFLRRSSLPRLLNSTGILDGSFIAFPFLLKEFRINQSIKVIHNLELCTSGPINAVRILHTTITELLEFSQNYRTLTMTRITPDFN